MNKYSLFALSVIGVLILFSFCAIEENNETITGIADDFKKTDSGYVFYISDGDGNRIKAFNQERIDDSIHSFTGRYSEDGKIFFVSKIR